MDSIFFLVLRRMRVPLIVLIVIYGVSILGLTLVPGITPEGHRAPPLSFFHAFYFISYTATTIGFGEIPTAFSDGQRLWVAICIYLTVVGWSYSILTLLALLQDRLFQKTLIASRFARRVRRMRSPFYLVCGCGETGSLIFKSLDRLGRSFVVIERDEQRVQELDLEDFKTDAPTLAADASLPSNLLRAGLAHPSCLGVLAVTDNEEANLAVTVAANLLNPAIPVIARARSPLIATNMRAFGTSHVIDPFDRFAEYLSLAVAAPERYHLIEILTGLPGSPLPEEHRPPGGHWIVCGYGRFGKAIVHHLAPTGIDLTVIDPESHGPEELVTVKGLGTESATLVAAGIARAMGIVAGSDNDVNNLAIAVTAKQLNEDLFVVVRQNQSASGVLFEKFEADFTMVQSRIVAQECIAILTTPLLAGFLGQVRKADEAWCRDLSRRLESVSGGAVPLVWGITLNPTEGLAVYHRLQHGKETSLGTLLRDNADRQNRLPAVVLMVRRQAREIALPEDDFALQPEDQILLASRSLARRSFELNCRNAKALHYVCTGQEQPSGWLWQRLFPEP
ncbi:MAG: potassium channel protein [Rhodocyclaceae bacterium]|nr:potassium channel protein [Rhodocyclaceae bacterium]